MTAITEAWRAGLLRRDNWMRNITAGIVVGVVSIPLSMAFAIASGATPVQGLYTSIAAGALASLFGGTRVQITGPTGAFAVLLFSVTAKYGMAGLQVATILAGIIMAIFGLTKLGRVIRFIPEPVVIGFTSGVAVLIWVSQWQNFFGLGEVTGDSFGQKLLSLFAALPGLHPATTLFGVASIAVILIWPKIPGLGKVPSPIVALVIATVVQSLFHIDGIATIGTAYNGLPKGLPAFTLPVLPLSSVLELLRPAFTIALLGSIVSLLSATVVDGVTGHRHDSDQELVGQGIANIGAALFGGFAAAGAVARSATSVRNGATSPLAGIVTSCTLLVGVVVLAPLAFNVPLATLAGVIFVVSYNMSDAPRVIRTIKRAPRADVAIMLITLVLTVFTDIIVAVNVGVILAMLNLMSRMSTSVETRTMEADEIAEKIVGASCPMVPEGVLVYAIEGPFFFGAVQQFERALEHTHTEPTMLVVSLKHVPFIDLTGIIALKEVIQRSAKHGIDVRLCCANGLVTGKLDKAGVSAMLGMPVSATLAEALAQPDSAA
ncbi:MAG: STAS domain-containing protein [Coriobacteriia bacterium]|nr:STAS domain-containing protein [Coriobacteriia bacterium]MBN2821707.1 STAS domain-containing protein [Coriobacteriia bacterium]